MSKYKTTTEATKVTIPLENNVQPEAKTPAKETKQAKEVKQAKKDEPLTAKKQPAAEKQAKNAEPVIVKEPVKEPEVVTPPATTKAGSITYRVQLFALAREKSLIDPEFEDLADVQMYIEDGMYKYTSGVFDTHEEALQYRSEMVRNGFSDAFVVTFVNGKRIYISLSY
jgi:hypothetical protein